MVWVWMSIHTVYGYTSQYLATLGTHKQELKLNTTLSTHTLHTSLTALNGTVFPALDYDYRQFKVHWGSFFDQHTHDYVFYHTHIPQFGLGLRFTVADMMVRTWYAADQVYVSGHVNSIVGVSFYSNTYYQRIFSVFSDIPFSFNDDPLFSVHGGIQSRVSDEAASTMAFVGGSLPLQFRTLSNTFKVTVLSSSGERFVLNTESSVFTTVFDSVFQEQLTSSSTVALLENSFLLTKKKHTFFITYKKIVESWLVESGLSYRQKPYLNTVLKFSKDSATPSVSVMAYIKWYSSILWTAS